MFNLYKIFYLFLIIVITEGIIRKWMLPSLSSVIFIIKYLLLFQMTLIYIKSNKYEFNYLNYPYFKTYFIFFIFCFLNLFVSYFSFKTWLIGILSYFAFSILLFVTPKVITNIDNLNKLLKYILWITLFTVILGLIQFYLPPSHILNTYAGESEYIATSGNATRITTIFNYITGNTTFISFAVAITLFSLLNRSKKINIIAILTLILVFFNMFATGSRSVIVYIVLSSLIGLFSYLILFYKYNLFKTFIKSLAFIFLLYILSLYDLLPIDSLFTFLDRINSINDSSTGRVEWMINAIPNAIEKAGLMGYGIGGTNNISITISDNIFTIGLSFIPNELDQLISRIIFEIGIIGFIIFYILLLFIFFDMWTKIYLIKNKKMKFLSILLFSTLIQYYTFMNSIIFNWLGSVHFYLTIGLIISIFNIDKRTYIEP